MSRTYTSVLEKDSKFTTSELRDKLNSSTRNSSDSSTSTTSGSSVNTALKDTKTYQSSVNSGASFGFNDIVAAGVGASVAGSLLDPVIDAIKKAYESKAKDLGIGAFKEDPKTSNTSTSTEGGTSTAPVAPTAPTGNSGLAPTSSASKTSLIDVLKGSSDNVGAVAEVILYSNMQIVTSLATLNKSIEKLTDVVVLNGEVQQSYNDIALEIESMRHDVEVAYKEQALQSNYELIETYGELLASGLSVEATRNDLNSRMNAIDNVNAVLKNDVESLNDKVNDPEALKFKEDLLLKLDNLGVTIHRAENEIALTDKKLEKVNYELTPVSVSDIHGNDTITASPIELATMKNLGVATSTALENSTTADELGLDDFNESLDFSVSDLLKIFKFNGISDNLTAMAGISESAYASHTPNVDLK